jgi:hypothetical protein
MANGNIPGELEIIARFALSTIVQQMVVNLQLSE